MSGFLTVTFVGKDDEGGCIETTFTRNARDQEGWPIAVEPRGEGWELMSQEFWQASYVWRRVRRHEVVR